MPSGLSNFSVVPQSADNTLEQYVADTDYVNLKARADSSALNKPGIRVLLVVGAFIILNMAAITIHHIYLKISRSSVSYKTIELNIGPF